MAETNDEKQITFNYGHVMDMANAQCCDISREVVSDTYSLLGGNEEKTLGDLDRMMTYMYEKRHGFAGYLSFSYAQMTMLYLLGRYADAAKSIDGILHGIDAVERFCFTGNYLDADGKDSGFVNFSCGESEAELENVRRFSKDTFDTAKLVHSKASSFESGYSYALAGIVYHISVGDTASVADDCRNIRTICERIRKHMVEMENKPEEEVPVSVQFSDFGDVDDLNNSKKEEETNG